MEQQSYTKDCWNGPCDCPEHQPKAPKYYCKDCPLERCSVNCPFGRIGNDALIDELFRKAKHEDKNEQT